MKKLFLILPMCLLLGCQEPEKENKPANLISTSKMTQILIDIHVTEALVELNSHRIDSPMLFFNEKQEEIFKKHGIDEKIFRTSYDYYLIHERQLDKIYEVVIDSLNMREAKLQAN